MDIQLITTITVDDDDVALLGGEQEVKDKLVQFIEEELEEYVEELVLDKKAEKEDEEEETMTLSEYIEQKRKDSPSGWGKMNNSTTV